MTGIKYDTTWEQAQQMILENPAFADDDELLHMEKEDALIVFEDHIRELEAEEESERDKEKKRVRRLQRKNRDGFIGESMSPKFGILPLGADKLYVYTIYISPVGSLPMSFLQRCSTSYTRTAS